MLEKGLVHIYFGDGKGKTSSAIGLGIRALGSGLNVCMIQFLKSWGTGEIETLKKLEPEFKVVRLESKKGFINELNDKQKEILAAEIQTELLYAEELSEKCDVLILDEVLGVLENKLISIEQLKKFIINKPLNLELILTGRILPSELVSLADYISEVKNVKHPNGTGIFARKGIEY
jgi:cob(I)alamin adenosyltransferase